MKKFLLVGHYELNAGPANVNRAFIENADQSMDYIKNCKNKYLRRLMQIFKCILYKDIVFSGGVPFFEFCLVKLLRKRIYFIMHGCARYENKINQLEYSEAFLDREDVILEKVDKIIAVSENYANWVKQRYPQYKNKITYINNGIDINETYHFHDAHADNQRSIALTGGNRFQKCNLEICKAVELLNKEGHYNITVYSFGRFYPNGDELLHFPFVRKMGHMDKDTYYNKLKQIDLMVINSEVEPFGLVVGDALNCGCSLLLAKNVGAISIFKDIRAEDVVLDNRNIHELAQKIAYLLENSNIQRLFNSVDRQKCSCKQAFLNLKKNCINE